METGLGLSYSRKVPRQEIMETGNCRWPKICLKEEIMHIITGDPTKWGKELKAIMEGIEEGKGRWETIRNGNKELEKKVERGITIKTD